MRGRVPYFFAHLHDEAKCSCIGRAAGVLLGELFFEVMPVAWHVVISHRRPGKHQCRPTAAFGAANGVDEELEVLFAELGCRGPEKMSKAGKEVKLVYIVARRGCLP